MFEGLDEIDWSALTHAYGEATDVPALIRRLASRDEAEREEALHGAYGNIYHQGSRYPATVTAAPFLIEALELPWCRKEVLRLLGSIAIGSPWDMAWCGLDLEPHFDGPAFPSHGHPCRHFDADERATHRACYLAVAAGCPVYRGLLPDESLPVSLAASWLLAWFPGFAACAEPELRRLASDPRGHELRRASAWLALSHLEAETWSLRGSLSPGDPSAPEPFLGAIAAVVDVREYARAGADVPPPIAAAIQGVAARGVRDLFTDTPDSMADDWPWGTADELVSMAVEASRPVTGVRRQRLSAAVRSGKGREHARHLLERTFERADAATSPPRAIDPASWNREQRRVLEALVDQPRLWPDVARDVQVALTLDLEPTRESIASALRVADVARATAHARRPRPPAPTSPPSDAEIARLTAELDLASSDLRARAARSLGVGSPTLPIATLQRLADLTIDDPDSAVRTGASWAIQKAGAQALPLLPRLLEALGQGEAGRDAVPYAIAGMGLPALEPVLEALRSDDEPRAWAAQRAFPDVQSVGVEPILAALEDVHPRVREWAAISLQRALDSASFTSSARVVPALIERLGDPVDEVRQRAVWALQKVKPESLGPIVEAAATVTGEALGALLEVLQALAAASGAAILPALEPGLRSGDAHVRCTAVDLLGNLDLSFDASRWIDEGLEDPAPEVRRRAANVAGSRGSTAARLVPSLVQALDDPDPGVRTAAVTALGRVGHGLLEDAIARAGRLLEDEDAFARCEAAWALVRIGEPAVPTLLRALGGSATARELALWSLGLLRRRARQSEGELRALAPSSPLAAWALRQVSR